MEQDTQERSAIQEETRRDIAVVAADPDVSAKLQDFGIVAVSSTSSEFDRYHRDEFDALGQWPSTLDDLLRAENPWAVAGVAHARGRPACAVVGNDR